MKSRRRSRVRSRRDDDAWVVRARVERFGEPALLALLAGGAAHGYELLEQLPSHLRDQRVDVGNVYRALRGLEEDGLVSSEWRADLPGPTKRTYSLTTDGRSALDAWLDSLESLRDELNQFIDHARRGGEHV